MSPSGRTEQSKNLSKNIAQSYTLMTSFFFLIAFLTGSLKTSCTKSCNSAQMCLRIASMNTDSILNIKSCRPLIMAITSMMAYFSSLLQLYLVACQQTTELHFNIGHILHPDFVTSMTVISTFNQQHPKSQSYKPLLQ